MKPRLIVHGGAGPWEKDNHRDVLAGMRAAAALGWKALLDGGTAVEAVEKASIYLEDHPLFDAGYGSLLNEYGEVEMDALLVDATAGKFGAVAGLRHVKNPITLARLVMTETPHHFFVAEGAEQLAAKFGIPLVPNLIFVTTEEFTAYQQRYEDHAPEAIGRGTVGAVALDINGNIATATTTGGSPMKMKGRVGDVPIFGAGGYAEKAVGGASATGWGEKIMRHLLSKRVVDLIASGRIASDAAETAVRHIEAHDSPSQMGIIAVDAQGNIGASHSTAYMPVSWIDDDGQPHAAMKMPYFA